jgi:hypothetical protein
MKRLSMMIVVLLAVSVVCTAQEPPTEERLLRAYGSLTAADQRGRGGITEDTYSLSAPSDGVLELVTVSVDFEPRVSIAVDGRIVSEDLGQGNAARLRARVRSGDEIVITVGGEVAPGRSVVADYVAVASLSEEGADLVVGGSLTGALTSDDRTGSDGSYIDRLELRLPADTRVRIALSSDDFDTYLRVELPDGRSLENDDSAGTDSALSFDTREGGVARVAVTSYAHASTGEYAIEAFAVEQRAVRVGQTLRGELENDVAAFALTGEPGEAVEIELRSQDFDTYLEVTDPEGTYLYNDDADGISTSRIVYEISDAGEATITVSSFRDAGGAFELEVRPYRFAGPRIEDGYRLSDGEVITGTLGPHLPVSDGSYRQRFTFRAEKDDRIEITLRSDDIDSYLTVITPADEELTDDDSAGGLDSRLAMTAEERGLYEVYASDLQGSSIGEYTLSFVRRGDARLLLDTRGALTEEDPRDITGKHYDTYRFTVGSNRLVTIEVTSDDFDAYALVRSRSGEILHRDDDGGGDTNPRISFTAERSQTLELVVTSFTEESTGRYRVSIYE